MIKEVFLYSWCEDFVQSESPARTHDKSTKSNGNALFPAVHVAVCKAPWRLMSECSRFDSVHTWCCLQTAPKGQ